MNRHILVVDDEASLRDLACTCLEDLGGWNTTAAASGQEALAKAESIPLDAILLDVSMPEMDGFQCYEQLKANPTTQSIPVVLLTAKVLPDDRTRFAQMEIAGVITKPFDPVSICDQLSELLHWT
ncbi:response regulator [Thermocoleostomius sinensis]|jgi:CheY-like chemotaxis protein|uniref:Response regulator n=1 Tax=Thermocoleostomius sinensis A174 TaxID=2016057 RepID=A0A9E9CC52_9CYAN|nr:response regulator [Thermocoleostomius sinensis]WAL62000.1 response regulator [Thermocoleostomius sinensis A174]